MTADRPDFDLDAYRCDLPNLIDLVDQPVIEVLTGQGTVYGRGKFIYMTDRPTITLEREDGSRFTWIADLGWRFVENPPMSGGEQR